MSLEFGTIMQWVLQHKLLLSIALIVLLLTCRQGFISLIRKRAKRKSQDRRHLINTVKNAANLSLFVLLLGIWSNELQDLALSIAAFTVAIVLATREFIQCITGFIYATSTRIFRVGDWIQVGHHSGEVIESDWFKLTLLEVDLTTYEYTGKTLTLPNNLLITHPVKNLNFLKRYTTHSFVLVRDQSVNPYLFKDELLARAAAHCEHFKEVAVRYSNLIQKRLEVPISGPEPQIHFSTNHLGDTQAKITIFCPTDQAMAIEQKITQDYMALWFAHKQPLPQSAEKS